MIRSVASGLVVVAALAGAAPASAGWSEPETITGPHRYLVDLAADSDGGALAAWGQDGTGDSAWARAAAGGLFGAPDAFSSHLAGRIATDGDGRAWLAWQNDSGIHVLERGAPDPVTLGPANFKAVPVIAANPGGDVAVAWRTYRDGKWLVHVAVKPRDQGFGEPETLGTGTAAQDPVVTVTRSGEVVVAWFQNGSPREVLAAVAQAGDGFGAPVTVSTLPALYLQLIADGDGDATLVWLSFPGEGSRIVAARRPSGGTFGDARTVASGGVSDADAVGPPGVAALEQGWLLAFRRGQSVELIRVLGTDPGPERTLEEIAPDSRYRDRPEVAADPRDGRALVAWSSSDERVAVARRSADGAWSDSERVSPADDPVDDVRAAVADRPVVVWASAAGLFAARFSAPSPPPDDGPGPPPDDTPADVTPPSIAVRLASPLRLAALLPFTARASERVRLRIAAVLVTPRGPLGTVTTSRQLAEHRTTTFHVRLTRRIRHRARTALRQGRVVRLRLAVRATDAAGNARRVTRRAAVT